MEIESRQRSEAPGNTRRAAIRNDAHETLSPRSGTDREPVKETVLEALYRHHPEIGLEDILELNAVVPDPEAGMITKQIDGVFASVRKESHIAPVETPETAPETERATADHHRPR